MKKLMALLLFCQITFYLFAQDAVIAPTKMNVLYIGVPNPIEIAMPNVPSDKLKVSIDNGGEIIKVEDGKYLAFVYKTCETHIIVEVNKQISIKSFRVKYAPDPIAVLDGAIGSLLSLTSLQHSRGLEVLLPNLDYDAQCLINSYVVNIIAKGAKSLRFEVKGGYFPEEFRALFPYLEINTEISFNKIKARCPGDAVSRDLNDLNFIIK